MAKRVSRAIGFAPSDSADVASYRLYWGPSQTDGADTVLTNEGDNPSPSVDIGKPPTRDVGGETLHVVNLDAIPEIQQLAEGEYDFGVAAVDAVGNISDIQEVEDVSVDITPPNK